MTRIWAIWSLSVGAGVQPLLWKLGQWECKGCRLRPPSLPSLCHLGFLLDLLVLVWVRASQGMHGSSDVGLGQMEPPKSIQDAHAGTGLTSGSSASPILTRRSSCRTPSVSRYSLHSRDTQSSVSRKSVLWSLLSFLFLLFWWMTGWS